MGLRKFKLPFTVVKRLRSNLLWSLEPGRDCQYRDRGLLKEFIFNQSQTKQIKNLKTPKKSSTKNREQN